MAEHYNETFINSAFKNANFLSVYIPLQERFSSNFCEISRKYDKIIVIGFKTLKKISATEFVSFNFFLKVAKL